MFIFNSNTQDYRCEISGITFCCENPGTDSEKKAQKLSEAYQKNFKHILAFISKEIKDIFPDISEDELSSGLGKPTIDLDIDQLIYTEQELDEEHIFTIEYSGLLDKLLYFSIDG